MKKNFICPTCHRRQTIGKRLHASWTCPKCHHSIVPTREKIDDIMTSELKRKADFKKNKTQKHFIQKPYSGFGVNSYGPTTR